MEVWRKIGSKYFHYKLKFMPNIWAIGILFDAGRSWSKNENGIQILFGPIVFVIYYKGNL
jgi:hypothetical protein